MEAEDLEKVVHAVAEETRKTIDKQGFSEAQLIALEEIIQKVVRKMDANGFFSHDHEGGEMTAHYVERDNEDC